MTCIELRDQEIVSAENMQQQVETRAANVLKEGGWTRQAGRQASRQAGQGGQASKVPSGVAPGCQQRAE